MTHTHTHKITYQFPKIVFIKAFNPHTTNSFETTHEFNFTVHGYCSQQPDQQPKTWVLFHENTNAFPYSIWNLNFPNIFLALIRQSSLLFSAIKILQPLILFPVPYNFLLYFPTFYFIFQCFKIWRGTTFYLYFTID